MQPERFNVGLGLTLQNNALSTKSFLFPFLWANQISKIDNEYEYVNKKLSYCWETVRRESMPRIAEMDVEMTT